MTKLRLESLLVENFRSISGSHVLPLDADIVLVHGANGAGKTSLLSALELGATGSVAHLGITGSDPQLVNRNHPVGRVQLGLRSANETRLGLVELGPAGRKGEGALIGNERVDFLERCFLPQTVLGRLLESYVNQDRADSALVRFVKDLAGIDGLDSLIDGLYSAGHIARTRVLVPSWARLEQEVSERESAIARTKQEIDDSQVKIIKTTDDLREMLLSLLDHSQLEDDGNKITSRALEALRDSESARIELELLEGLRVRLAGVLNVLGGLDETQSGNDEVALSKKSLADRQSFEVWEEKEGAQLLLVLNEVRTRLGDSSVELGQMFEVFVETKDRVQARSASERRAHELEVENQQARASWQVSMAALGAEGERLEAARSGLNLGEDVRLLLEVLGLVLPLVESDACPVCDQRFPKGNRALEDHISRKIGGLSKNATQYQQLTAQIEELRVRVGALAASEPVRSLVQIASEPTSADLVRKLNSIESEVERGLTLKRAMDASLSRTAAVSSLRATLAVAKETLDQLFFDSGASRATEDLLGAAKSLETHLIDRQQAAQYKVLSAERIRLSLESMDAENRNIAELRNELVVAKSALKVKRSLLSEAKRRKSEANDLRMEAERVRAALISDVFDQALNESWADFFCRLVPSEPFVPQFKRQAKDARNIDVVLETVDHNGLAFGTPSSVLSFGNANTAALSLFLALHVSAPTAVDWLVFDDPVQSMDDIHIANFAALVRQLTVHHDRQVIVAVHQRELFDYLAFELAPAKESDQLIKIEIERRGNASRIECERMSYIPETAISSA